METTERTGCRIYVACLASYNNGILHGRWIDCESLDYIQDQVGEMLKASPVEMAEEWAIHDYEGFEGISLSEYTGFDRVIEYAGFIEEHGALGAKLYEHYNSLEEARTALEEHYAGEYKSIADFAEEITFQTTEIPALLTYYIDYEAMARDLEINDVLTIETGFEEVHVFWRF